MNNCRCRGGKALPGKARSRQGRRAAAAASRVAHDALVADALCATCSLQTTADVEAEKRYQEKRAAEKAGEPLPPPPVVLWRSARELGVWVKDLRRARTTGALGGAAYAAAALVDRAHVSGFDSAFVVAIVVVCTTGRGVWVKDLRRARTTGALVERRWSGVRCCRAG